MPQMSTIQQRLQQLLNKAKTTKYPELELSIGQLKDTFEPGVTFSHFQTLSELISATPSITSNTSHIITYIYTNGVRSRHQVGAQPVFQRKVLIDSFIFNCLERQVAVKVKLSAEIPEPEQTKKPVSVRLLQRQHCSAGNFVVDLSKTVSGKTKVKACENTPTFEVELEVTKFDTKPAKILQKLSSLLGTYDTNGAKIDLTFRMVM